MSKKRGNGEDPGRGAGPFERPGGGKSRTRVSPLRKLAEALGVEPRELIKEEE